MDIVRMYLSEMSVRDIVRETGINYSAVRKVLNDAGVMRSRMAGVDIASEQGKQATGRLGKKFPHSDDTKAKMSETHLKRWEKIAVGTRVNDRGYLEFTRGPFKGRTVHSVVLEQKIGRKLLPHECTHHVDHNKLNNNPDNLVVMTRSEHTSHHRKDRNGVS